MLKNMIQRLWGNSHKKFSYEEAKGALENKKNRDKIKLASQVDTKPEVLYYLASDSSPEIRREIAINKGTPYQADTLLITDNDTEVRQELARKIARMLPDLEENEVDKIREQAILILEKLADDQLPQVRRIVAEELKTFDSVPKHIIMRLAQDDHLEVCAPVLEYSPLLSTEDLKEIIAATTVQGAIESIARRNPVVEDVSEAITASLDIPAVTTLLTNKNAQIRESTLDAIIDQAEKIEELHPPMVSCANLSIRAIKRIAGFVASSLVDQMISSYSLNEEVAEDLLDRVRQRIKEGQGAEQECDDLSQQANDLYKKGLLDDSFIENVIQNRQRELLFHCLAKLSNMPIASIKKIISSKKARRVVALAWRCELNMRTALKIQREISCITTSNTLNAKDGRDYPLSKAEMSYDLALYDGGS